MFSNLGRPVEITNLTLDNIQIVQENSDKGVGIIAGGLEFSTASETLILDSVATTAQCLIRSKEKSGGFIGCCRGYNSVTVTNCTNAATIISSGKNAGGFFGTSSYTKNFYFELCENNGSILSTNSSGFVAGFVSQAQSAIEISFINCASNGEIDNRAGAGNISWFVGHRAGTLTYEGNTVSAKVTVKNETYVTERSQTGISVEEGVLTDYINLVNVPKIDVSFDNTETMIVSPVDSADHYEVDISLSCLKGNIEGNKFTQTNDTDYVYNLGSFATVDDLKNVKKITRVGHVLPDNVTEFDCHYDCQAVSSNHYRLSSKGSYTTDVPSAEQGIDGWYVLFGNEGAVTSINFYETVWLQYNIIAKDSTGTVLASSSWRIGGSSASPFMNMAGSWYRGSAPHYTPIIL